MVKKSDRARIFNTTTLKIVICLASKFLNCSPKIQAFLLVRLSMIMERPLPLVPYSSLVPVFDSSAMYSRPSPSLFQLHEVHPSLCSQVHPKLDLVNVVVRKGSWSLFIKSSTLLNRGLLNRGLLGKSSRVHTYFYSST